MGSGDVCVGGLGLVHWEKKHMEGGGWGGGSKARSPSPERAAVNTQPLGGGSQPKALRLMCPGPDSLVLSSPCTGLQ